MFNRHVTFIFVHGAWHDHHTWDSVIPQLRAQGLGAEALDLPGAGTSAGVPDAFIRRPIDLALFSTQPSPNAGVTQLNRNMALADRVDKVVARTGRPVVLVSHSFGGLTVTPVVEAHPEKIRAAVYISAFLLASGETAAGIIQSPAMTGSQVPALLLADPAVIGGLRMDVASTDLRYQGQLKEAFYADVDMATFERLRMHLHPDEPAGVMVEPSSISAGRFGTVPRHFIRCTEDRVVTLAAQDQMVARVDEETRSITQVHTFTSSHSPFASMPAQLVETLVGIVNRQSRVRH